jgi:hypothetical protein
LTGLPPLRRRKEGATAGQYAPKLSGYTRAAMVKTMSSDLENGRQSPNFTSVETEG